MADRVGQQLGNYRLVQLLGEGGFAEVYLGEHIHLGTPAAIKVLSAKLHRDEIDRFREEARTIALLKHPYIVRMLDFGVESGVPYLVMEYAAGGTLRQRHPKGTRLAPATILPYVRQVASALQFAHDRKLIHRDVKPENMLLGESDEVLLSDFGIAIVSQSSRYQGTQDSAGTLAYMPPEQIQGHPRPASDQYSLGIIYEWVAGERPFTGSMTEVLAQQLSVPPPPLRQKLPNLSPQLEQVVLTALEKDPKARFASVQAFVNAFEQACQPTATPPITSLPPPIPVPPTSVPPGWASVPPPSKPAETRSVAAMPPRLHIPAPTTSPLSPAPRALAKPARGISRRTVLIGGGALAGVVVVGGGIWLARSLLAPPSPALFTYRGYVSGDYFNLVDAVAWSPDSTRITSGSTGGPLQVWDALTGDNALTYMGRLSPVAWSPDGAHIVSGASGGSAGGVQVWDASSGNTIFTFPDNANAVAWAPNNAHIASSGESTVKVWDAINGSNLFTYSGHSGAVYAVAWSPDGKYIASGGVDNTVQVWDAGNGTSLFTYGGHSDHVNGIAWSSDSKRIASGSTDNTVQVWDALTGDNVFTYRGHSDKVAAVAWSPDGTRVASGSDDTTVQVWDASDGGNVFTYRGHSKQLLAVAWSPDGRYIASSCDDQTVQVWAP